GCWNNFLGRESASGTCESANRGGVVDGDYSRHFFPGAAAGVCSHTYRARFCYGSRVGCFAGKRAASPPKSAAAPLRRCYFSLVLIEPARRRSTVSTLSATAHCVSLPHDVDYSRARRTGFPARSL